MYEYLQEGGGPTRVVRIPEHELMPPGVVVVEPTPIPYEKSDRTPEGPLKDIHDFTAAQLGIHPDLLISLRGQLAEHGCVVQFACNREPADREPASYVVGAYHALRSHGKRFFADRRASRTASDRVYDVQLKEVS